MAIQTLTDQSTGKYAQAGKYKVYYNEAGTGDAVFMLHGGGPGASGWSNFVKNIGPFSEKYRTILLDAPGFGRSDTVPTIDVPRDMVTAQAVKDLMDQLGIEKASLIGNSMGGASTVRFGLEFPDRLDKAVLMGAGGAGLSIFQPMPMEGIKILFDLYRNPTLEGLKKMISVFVYDSSFATDELIQGRYEAMMASKEHIDNFVKAMANPASLLTDFTPRLGEFKSKTLITWGRDDRFVPLDHGLKFLWGIPDARMHIFSQCGHWAQFEKAEEFNSLIMNFFES